MIISMQFLCIGSFVVIIIIIVDCVVAVAELR